MALKRDVLIIGAGLTGAVTSALLETAYRGNMTISIWEKAIKPGGRMTTRRDRNNSDISVDLGAQYISCTQRYADKHKLFYSELVDNKILTSLQGTIEGDQSAPDTKHFVAPHGTNSIVTHYLNQSGCDVAYESSVKSVRMSGNRLEVSTEKEMSATFDAVISTVPVPQAVNIAPQFIDDHKEIKAKLDEVSYSSRFALGIFYPPKSNIGVSWCAKYIDDPVVRFVSIDNQKRNADSDLPPSVLVHTSVPFGIKHLESDVEAIKEIIYTRFREMFPRFPDPAEIKLHKWRYSQVYKHYEGQPGCVVLNKSPLLILGGDAFVHSNYDGCIESALSVLSTFKTLFPD